MLEVSLGPVVNGKQSVTLPTKEHGVYTSVTAEKEKVDEFMSERSKIRSATNTKVLLSEIASIVVGAGVGALLKIKDMKMLEKTFFGAVVGSVVGLLAAFGFDYNGSSKISKLTEKFINENA